MIDDINKIIENRRILLHKPSQSELRYRQRLHQELNQEDIERWFNRFNSSMRNYYAYIVSKEEKRFVGEVYIFYDFKEERYRVHVYIEENYRQQGYGLDALSLMVDYAFTIMNLDAIYEEVSLDQTYRRKIYKTVGFERVDDELISMTKKQYNDLKKLKKLN